MKQKDSYIYRIMKEHQVLVDFDGEVQLKHVPSPKDRETFKRWTQRVLGDGVSNVTVLEWHEPGPGEQMSTLRKHSGSGMVERIINALKRDGKANEKAAVSEGIHNFTTFPRQSLDDVLKELDDTLEPSVRTILKNIHAEAEEQCEFDDLLRRLITSYNSAVRTAREIKGKPAA